MKLTNSQRTALAMAYAADVACEVDDDEGPRLRTIRALVKRGLLQDDDDNSDCFILTAAGREAVEIPAALARKPTTALAAVTIAVAWWVGEDAEVHDPAVVAMPLHDEGDADWTGVLALVERPDYDDVGWVDYEAAATLATELGFPCYVEEVNHYFVAYWAAEDE